MTEISMDNNPDPETNPIEPHTETSEPAKSTSNVIEKHHSRTLLRVSLETYWRRKKWALPITVLAVLIIVLLVPFTRYKVLGMFLKETVSFSVIDSTTGTPISGTLLQFGKTTATTSANGKTTMKLPVGDNTLMVSKQYYMSAAAKIFTSLTKSHNSVVVRLVAIGRQVPIVVINKITGKPVANAELKVLNTEAKTDKNGKETIVLPEDKVTQYGAVSANGYNQAAVTVQITSLAEAANTYSLTPTGSVYFLSNLSGKIDVVKSDLDGTNRRTVLPGTGFENQSNTTLLASRDWKFLALYTQRKATGNPEIDLIDTGTDTMSNIDEGNANFTLVGWDDDSFIYQVDRNGVPAWQNGQQALKSFSAPAKKITVLVQTTGSGTGPGDYISDRFGSAYILNGKVVYSLNWFTGNCYYSDPLSSKQATINSINPDGSGAMTIKGFSPFSGNTWCNLSTSITPYDKANSLAIVFPPSDAKSTFYEYKAGKDTLATDISAQNFYANNYPTYLLSPSGNNTFWSVYTDGKNSLKVGDKNGQNAKIIANESDYSPYGWFTDGYLIVQKSGSELYIMSSDGTSQPFKITNYYKPQGSYRGYGGGYGGL